MRTIKFRGKDVNTGEWAYGSLIKFDIGYVILTNEKTERNSTLGVDNCIVFSEKEIAVVFPRTIGQSTGLLDKNGKEIYEGDIVAWSDSDGNHRIDVVKWMNGGLCLCNSQYTVGSYVDLEVIGSIHDNPELLKGGKE